MEKIGSIICLLKVTDFVFCVIINSKMYQMTHNYDNQPYMLLQKELRGQPLKRSAVPGHFLTLHKCNCTSLLYTSTHLLLNQKVNELANILMIN